MSNILLLAESGFGKSHSIGKFDELGHIGLDPTKTFIISVTNKPLPFRGWKKNYVLCECKPTTGNYMINNGGTSIADTIAFIAESRLDIENIVIDDMQYIMSDYYMQKAKKGGFDVFKDIGFFMGKIFHAFQKFTRGNIIVTSHYEPTNDDSYKAKTVGKMVDQYLTIEGKFEIVLYGRQEYDEKSKKAVKQFVTNYDGQYPAKSPYGMFEDLYIKNDLGFVISKLNEYYNG
jgi:hypothetical protein